jgi:hypothetical protein
MAIETFGTEREDIKSSKFKSYKGKEGQTDRIGIVFTSKKEMYKGARIHYNEKYYVCKSEWKDNIAVNKAICCTASYKGNKPKWRIGAVVIVYHIQNKDGKDILTGYELIPWVFGETMYNTLREIDKETSLETHDIKLKCKNEEFQNMDIITCDKSIWRSSPNLQKKILAEFPALVEDVKGNLGQDLNLEEIKELLGVETPGSQDASADIAMGDVLESV